MKDKQLLTTSAICFFIAVVAALFLIFYMVGCDAQGDNDPKNVRAVWDPNPEPDMSHYEVYWWQSDDSASFQGMFSLQYIENIAHILGSDSITSSYFQLSFDFVASGCVAVDSSGKKSGKAITRIYRYSEFFAPSRPDSLRIIECWE